MLAFEAGLTEVSILSITLFSKYQFRFIISMENLLTVLSEFVTQHWEF